jgi:3-hydroxyisobutyrate dehydrogenase-like beta-hydroxyacid dehydrogenase
MTRVALLGLGSIGAGMAGNLAAADGIELRAWNRGMARRDRAATAGVPVTDSVEEALRGAEVAILSLSDDAAVTSVLGVLLAELAAGAVVVDTTTVSPETSRTVAARLAERGIGFVDAPVTGGAEMAQQGTLTLLCGGSEDHLAAVQPVLEQVSRRIVHVGEVGAGELAKAVNQVILAGTFLGVAEGVALARRSGLDAGALMAELKEGAAASWVLNTRAAMMVERDLAPRGRLALHLKDLRIAEEAARQAGLELRLGSLVADLEQQLVDQGHGDKDVAAIILAVE